MCSYKIKIRTGNLLVDNKKVKESTLDSLKLRNKGFASKNKNDTSILVDFIDNMSNDILYRISLDGTPREVKKKSRHHTNRSSYYPKTIWKKAI